jgi:hypothetical protein
MSEIPELTPERMPTALIRTYQTRNGPKRVTASRWDGSPSAFMEMEALCGYPVVVRHAKINGVYCDGLTITVPNDDRDGCESRVFSVHVGDVVVRDEDSQIRGYSVEAFYSFFEYLGDFPDPDPDPGPDPDVAAVTLDESLPAEAVFAECIRIMRGRAVKYNGSSSWDSSFKHAAAASGTTPEQVARVLLAVKRARQEAGDGSDHADDSLRDSFVDEINYLVLALALRDSSVT